MSRVLFVLIAVGALGVCGCTSNDQPAASQANSAESAPYSPGTGVSSSSFDRHPRFYTGTNGEAAQALATQPANP